MTRQRILLAAATASLAVCAASSFFVVRPAFGADDPAAAANTPRAQTGSDRQPSRAATADADERSLRVEMARIVEDATTPGHADQLMSHFTTFGSNRARTAGAARGAIPPPGNANANPNINDDAPQHANDNARPGAAAPAADSNRAAAGRASVALDEAIVQLQKDWREKYGQDFSLRGNEATVFNDRFARINVGDYGDAARTASERVTPAPAAEGNARSTHGAAADQNVNDNAPQHAPNGIGSSSAAGTPSRTGGTAVARNRAVVTIPESHGVPAATVRFVQDGESWKIDSGDSPVDRARLQAALARHLETADRDRVNWPAKADDGYRAIAHHVLLAISESQNSANTSNDRRTDRP